MSDNVDGNYNNRLIPVLVACTVYSADQIAEFESLPEVDEHIPDAPEDIRPMFHRAKSGGEMRPLPDAR